jgi:adenine deaminase
MHFISGNIIDIRHKNIYPGKIYISNGIIEKIQKVPQEEVENQYILPGFIDAHVHIESSMLVPSEFARLAVPHGTIATISDPHEIGNVLGVEGVEYMIKNGKKVIFKFYFGAPSCVPATTFETAGAKISASDIHELLKKPEVKYLAEMMNWPGVLYKDKEVYEKISIAQKLGKPVDGHAPGLVGEQAKVYIDAGISTDHECFTKVEALDKLKYGMKILIREGSAAKNFEELVDLLNDHSEMIMFCSDDKHPDSLVEGHINLLVKRALAKGIDLYKILQAACINPVEHYNLEVGTLRPGDAADFIVIDNLQNFQIIKSFINGHSVAENGISLIERIPAEIINQFNVKEKFPEDFEVKAEGEKIRVIEAMDGQLITNEIISKFKGIEKNIESDPENDLLKIAVVNRYSDQPPAVAFIKNFGLKQGSIASSVAHDSHNIIVVGVTDEEICRAVNLLIESKGGVVAVNEEENILLPLPVAGLMSDDDGYKVAEIYSAVDRMAKSMGSTLQSPFMTLSFMALLVIPSLKLSDKGLFNGEKFEFTSNFILK